MGRYWHPGVENPSLRRDEILRGRRNTICCVRDRGISIFWGGLGGGGSRQGRSERSVHRGDGYR